MCVESQSSDSLEKVYSVFHLPNEYGEKCGIPSPSLKGISRTITQSMPNRNFNVSAHLFKAEIWIGLTGLYDADYVVVLDRIGIDIDLMGTGTNSMNDVPSNVCDARSCYLKKPVLVSVGEVSNNAQKRRKDWMRSIERLNMGESIPEFRLQSSELLVKGFGELFGIVNDDETETLFIAGRSVNRRNLAEGVNEVIQNGSKIVDAVSDNQRPPDDIGRRTNSQHPNAYPGKLCATFEKGFITATVEPCVDFSVNRLEVFFSAV